LATERKKKMRTHGELTGAKHRVLRNFMGLPLDWCAARYGLSETTISGWEESDEPFPPALASDFTNISHAFHLLYVEVFETSKDTTNPLIEVSKTEPHIGGTVSYPPSFYQAAVACTILNRAALRLTPVNVKWGTTV
jgi:hypothetical protein